MPWECVWILIIPLVAPNLPRKILVVSLLEASTGPLVLWYAAAVRGENVSNTAISLATYFLFTTYLCAGIAYVAYFPLGGFQPLQFKALARAAKQLNASPSQVALAWLLHRSSNILAIPGTSALAHLRENLAAAQLRIPEQHLTDLNAIGAVSPANNHAR